MSLFEPQLEPDNSIVCCYSAKSPAELLEEAGVMVVVSPSEPCEPGENPRHYGCGLPSLSQTSLHEVWYTSGLVQSGVEGDCHWSQSDEMLFVALWVDESGYASHQKAICDAYSSLLSFITKRSFQYIVRAWNYIPNINHGEGDLERYRQFCSGREQAFASARYASTDYPSACALGHGGDKTVIYLLSGKKPISHIENPRQESAYRYPGQYGPASPSFARASLARWAAGSQLYISGTASILGHQSCHPGNLHAQLQTTFDNIDALLENSARQAGLPGIPRMSLLKVYVRDPTDFHDIQKRVSLHFQGVPALYLRADICRHELLVEIDGICELDKSLPAQGATHRQL